MFGHVVLGFLMRNAKGLEIKCGNCGYIEQLRSVDLPAAISIADASQIHVCGQCKLASPRSQINEKPDCGKYEE
jgi:hypothetical protein